MAFQPKTFGKLIYWFLLKPFVVEYIFHLFSKRLQLVNILPVLVEAREQVQTIFVFAKCVLKLAYFSFPDTSVMSVDLRKLSRFQGQETDTPQRLSRQLTR